MGGDDAELLDLLRRAATAVRRALDEVDDWRPRTERPGQYAVDLVADEAALDVLVPAGVGVLSEESGATATDREIVVVLDPIDGSTNAARRVPWYATSLCAVDAFGPRVAVVVNQATGERFEAVRDAGARLDGAPIRPSACATLGAAVLGVAGYPPRHLGWKQLRAFGAAALDLCAVACGRLDAFAACVADRHGPWDYLGALLVCREAGAQVADLHGRDLVTLDHRDRRTVVAAATAGLLAEVVAACRAVGEA